MDTQNWHDGITDWSESIDAHMSWKHTFRDAITKKQSLDAIDISRDDLCLLGHFLYRKGMRHQTGSHYGKLMEAHARFHQEAGIVAKVVNSGNYDRAMVMLGEETPYELASEALVSTILSIMQEIKDRTTVYPVKLSTPVAWH
jgi:methyl-accepting chemotaxis protein